MKLSDFAKQEGVPYTTAHNWWKLGYLRGYQRPTGTIVLDDKEPYKNEEEIREIKDAKRERKDG